MLENTSFTFNGKSTSELGLVMINPKKGLYEETFLPSRSIVETSVYKNEKRYFKGVEVEPLSFSLFVWIKDWQQQRNMRSIARWLSTETYAPFWFDSEPDKIYYAILENEVKLIHNGAKDGYLELKLRCDSPYSYSPLHNIYLDVNGTEQFGFFNEGDATLYPFLKIKQKENKRPIIIRNLTDNKLFFLSNILLNEEVYIDCENQIIRSNQEDNVRYLYDEHNGYWLPFEGESKRGNNTSYEIQLNGRFTVDFSYEYKYLHQGDGAIGW